MDAIRSPASMGAKCLRGALSLLFVTACSGKDPYSPGTKLGTFHVSAKLTHTTCGPVPDPWEFDVRLNHDGSTLYWVQGGAPVEGRVDSSARSQLIAQMVQDVRPSDGTVHLAPCSIARTDEVVLTLASADGNPATDPALTETFSGGLIYTFTPTEGSDCSDQLTAVGGDFDALPCEVGYDLSGQLTSSPR
jgi:hypothetical protein